MYIYTAFLFFSFLGEGPICRAEDRDNIRQIPFREPPRFASFDLSRHRFDPV